MPVQPALVPQADNPSAMSARSPVLELFHPAVAGWFARAFPGPTQAQVAGLAVDRRRAPHARRRAHRIGQDADRVHGRHRCAGPPGPVAGRAAGSHAGRLRLAAQGAVERHPPQPRSAARRHPRRTRTHGPARCRHPHRGAHGRHDAERARAHAQVAAAHPGHHARIAVRAAGLRFRPRDAGDRAHGDRRRNPRRRREQARQPPFAVARTPGCPVRPPPHARGPVGDAEADRRSRALPRRRKPCRAGRGRLRHRRHRLRARTRPRARSPAHAAAGGDVERAVGAGLHAHRATGRNSTRRRWSSSTRAAWPSAPRAISAICSARNTSPRTTVRSRRNCAWPRSNA